MSLPAVRRLTHTSPRTLARLPVSRLPTVASSSSPFSKIAAAPRVARTSQFSTMAARQSAAPSVQGDKSYDPEIKDMATYIHDYNVDSDLAVSGKKIRFRSMASTHVKFCDL